ncbi:MAG: metallophosphoesterase family protein [Candidatus Omnitrophica bacterium]|nr:metallophosphoesterase family protein [Candidatus Omnitrophota bacterium]
MRLVEILSFVVFSGTVGVILAFEWRWLLALIRRQPLVSTLKVRIIHCIFFLGCLSAVDAFFIEPYWLEVRHIDIKTDKLKQASFVIVQISDLHCDKQVRNEERLVRIVNDLKPDAIVFTGDSINSLEALPLFKSTLSRLEATSGKFAVQGNWDVWYWPDADIFRSTGFEELDGRFKIVKRGADQIAVAGLNPWKPGKMPLVLDKVPADIFKIFLFHYPGIHEEIGVNGVDLFLSGHVHGGQVALPFYGAIVTLSKYGKKYEDGLYPLAGGSHLFVSRGVGMEGGAVPRVRFFARPEITVFHIQPKNEKHE